MVLKNALRKWRDFNSGSLKSYLKHNFHTENLTRELDDTGNPKNGALVSTKFKVGDRVFFRYNHLVEAIVNQIDIMILRTGIKVTYRLSFFNIKGIAEEKLFRKKEEVE